MSSLRNNVDRLLKARGLSEADLSKRTSTSKTELVKFLQQPPKRKATRLRKIATELVVPDFFLLSEDLTPSESIADFRLAQPRTRGYQRATIKAIEFAKQIQYEPAVTRFYKKGSSLSENIEGNTPARRAASLRELIGLTDSRQFEFENAQLMYAFVRREIEKLETMIFQFSFPTEDGAGFAIAGDNAFDVIVINTSRQIPARRLFTLGHEVYHCILNETGISDPDTITNNTETLCNVFAAEFLAPQSLVSAAAKQTISSTNFEIDELRRFATLTKLSLSAALYRLVEVGLYNSTAVARWKAFISSTGNPDFTLKTGGGKRLEEWKYKLSKYGTKFAEVFGEVSKFDLLDDYEIYRLSGIKPKYQQSYFTNAPKASLQDDAEEEADA